MEGELGIVRFLSDDRLQIDCNGQIAPPIGHIVLHNQPNLPPYSAGEYLSTIYTRTRVIPEKPDTFSGPVLVLMKGARRSAHGQSRSQS